MIKASLVAHFSFAGTPTLRTSSCNLCTMCSVCRVNADFLMHDHVYLMIYIYLMPHKKCTANQAQDSLYHMQYTILPSIMMEGKRQTQHTDLQVYT